MCKENMDGFHMVPEDEIELSEAKDELAEEYQAIVLQLQDAKGEIAQLEKELADTKTAFTETQADSDALTAQLEEVKYELEQERLKTDTATTQLKEADVRAVGEELTFSTYAGLLRRALLLLRQEYDHRLPKKQWRKNVDKFLASCKEENYDFGA